MVDCFSIEELLPHRGNMLLLDELIEHDDESIVTMARVRGNGLFDVGGYVPAWIGIEYMAQSVAAWSGLRARQRDEAPRMGFLLGTRLFTTSTDKIALGTQVFVMARQLIVGKDGMAAFECTVRGETLEQAAMLSVYEPKDPEEFLGENQHVEG